MTTANEAKPKVFLSYGHDAHAPLVLQIADDLRAAGFHVWIDTYGNKAGEAWRRTIVDGLMASHGVLAFLSEHSMKDPGACRDELGIALGLRGLRVITALLEDETQVDPPSDVAEIQWIDLKDWRAHVEPSDITMSAWYQAKMSSIVDTLKSAHLAETLGEIDQVRRLLQVTPDNTKALLLRHNEVVERVAVRQAIDEWRRAESQPLLLIVGGPGSGKSTLVASELQLNQLAICGAFCHRDSPRASAPHTIMRRLAFGLAARLPDYRAHLLTYLRDVPVTDLTAGELLRDAIIGPLSGCIDGGRATYVALVDGLDEAALGPDDLTTLLQNHAQDLPRWLKLIVTSQPNDRILRILGEHRTLDLQSRPLRGEDEELGLFVRTNLARLERPDLADKIVAQASGNFLHAALSLRALEFVPDSDWRTPAALDSTYLILVDRATARASDHSAMTNVLEVLVADSNLPRATLREASSLDKVNFAKALEGLRPLLDIDISPRGYDTDGIRLFHPSFREWLTDVARAGGYAVDQQRGASRLYDVAAGELGRDPLASPELWVRMAGEYAAMAGRWDEWDKVLVSQHTSLEAWKVITRRPDTLPFGVLERRLHDLLRHPSEGIRHGGRYGSYLAELREVGQWLMNVKDWDRSPDFLDYTLLVFPWASFFRSGASQEGEPIPGLSVQKLGFARAVHRYTIYRRGSALRQDLLRRIDLLRVSATYISGTAPDWDEMSTFAFLNFMILFFGRPCELYSGDLVGEPLSADLANAIGHFNTCWLATQLRYGPPTKRELDIQRGLQLGASLERAEDLARGGWRILAPFPEAYA